VSESDQGGWVSVEQAQQMAADAARAAVESMQQQHTASTVGASGSISVEQAKALIAEALARQNEAHTKALQDMAASLRGNVVTFVPHNAGGPGTEIAETWSAWEQSLAIKADDEKRQAAAREAETERQQHSDALDSLFPSVHA
jgi:hypothetical protein